MGLAFIWCIDSAFSLGARLFSSLTGLGKACTAVHQAHWVRQGCSKSQPHVPLSVFLHVWVKNEGEFCHTSCSIHWFGVIGRVVDTSLCP